MIVVSIEHISPMSSWDIRIHFMFIFSQLDLKNLLDRLQLFGRNYIFAIFSYTTQTNRVSFKTRNRDKTKYFDRMIVLRSTFRKKRTIYSAQARNRLLYRASESLTIKRASESEVEPDCVERSRTSRQVPYIVFKWRRSRWGSCSLILSSFLRDNDRTRGYRLDSLDITRFIIITIILGNNESIGKCLIYRIFSY